MRSDVTQFRAFYDSRLGAIARRLVRRALREMWPDVRGLTIAGFGYPTPYLAPFVEEAATVVALMPADQGAAPWPRSGRNRVALADETDLPFEDGSLDRVVLIHGLETSDAWRSLLRQVWRVLKPDGRLLVVAPSRSGMWASFGETPYGDGHPYSSGQLDRLLADAMFQTERRLGALYGPPTRWRWIMRTGRGWERAGRRLYPGMPGVWLVEATKAMYAPAGGARGRPARVGALAAARADMNEES